MPSKFLSVVILLVLRLQDWKTVFNIACVSDFQYSLDSNLDVQSWFDKVGQLHVLLHINNYLIKISRSYISSTHLAKILLQNIF